jgi:L-alanine-DL-glutamate epimerase-like enolase superfamily enzyme
MMQPTTPTIVRVEFVTLDIPYPKPRRFGRHVLTSGENVLVRVIDSSGHIGYGEAVARPYIYGESATSIVHAISNWFGPSMIGMSVFDSDAIWEAWDLVAANVAAKAGLDMAVYDLQAQAVGLPLWRWLGGQVKQIPLSWILTYGTPADTLTEAQGRSAEGFEWFKVKVSADREHDTAVLRALRGGLPRSTRYYADANGTLTRSELLRRMGEFEELGIELLEDPLSPDDITTRGEVWASCPIPFLADETATTVSEAVHEIRHGGVDVFSLKIFRTGIHRSREITTIARAFGRDCLIGGQGETHVGAVIAGHVASGLIAATGGRYPAETASAYRFDFDLVASGGSLSGGRMVLTDRPGSGIEIDEDVVARLASPTVWNANDKSGNWFRV